MDVSDEDGIYELPATAGDYNVCLRASPCTAVRVPDGGRVRADLALPFATFTVRQPATCAP